MDDWHKSLLGLCKFDSMVDLELSIKKCDNFIRPHTCDYTSKASKLSISLRFSGLFFELVAARFYAFVKATESASHVTNREPTSYELKVIESLNFLVENFLHQV